jgi:hypothetical protein
MYVQSASGLAADMQALIFNLVAFGAIAGIAVGLYAPRLAERLIPKGRRQQVVPSPA